MSFIYCYYYYCCCCWWYNYYLPVNQSWIKIHIVNDIHWLSGTSYLKFHHEINTFLSQICHQTKRMHFHTRDAHAKLKFLCCTIDYSILSIAWHLILTAMSTKFNELKAILSRHWLIYVTSMKWNRSWRAFFSLFFLLLSMFNFMMNE